MKTDKYWFGFYKVFISVLLFLLVSAGAGAQKVDQRLIRLVEHAAASRAQSGYPDGAKALSSQIPVKLNADGTVSTLSAIATLEKGAECPTALLEQMGIEVRFVLDDMVALVIPADKMTELEQVDAFSYVRADEYVKKDNEEARLTTGVEQVNTASASQANGLPEAFTGEGVVLGIIDGGIDFNHAAFCHPDGTTRVKKVFYFTNDKMKAYTGNKISKLTSDGIDSHGTHVAAIAGGSDLGNGQKGVAPQADLILCGIDEELSNVNIIDCIKSIFDYADQVGKPAVINLSLGNPLGLHDGSEMVGTAIAKLTDNGTMSGISIEEGTVTLLDDLSASLQISDCAKALGLVFEMSNARRNYADFNTIEQYTQQLNELVTASMTCKGVNQHIPMRVQTAKIGIDYWAVPALNFADENGYVALTDMLDKESIEYMVNIADHAAVPMYKSLITVNQLLQYIRTFMGYIKEEQKKMQEQQKQ